MELELDPTERRIVGVLLEKSLATPEGYPLSLNALIAGCNQKSNRDPVVHYQDFEVEGALRSLFQKHWVTNSDAHGRVLKWKHRVAELLGFERREQAVLAELFLRGAQQPGELRARAARMAPELKTQSDLMDTIASLQQKDPPFVARLGHRTGERADRYHHTLSPPDEQAEAPPPPPTPSAPPTTPVAPTPTPTPARDITARVESLEATVRDLERRLRDLEPPGDPVE